MTHESIPFRSVLMQTLRLVLTTAGIGLVLYLFTAQAGHAADAAAGKTLALRWCASCHLVSEDQETVASSSLPTFYDMANDPGWTEASLATFLANPHPAMPDMSLGTIEIANLTAYINSLNP